MLDFNYNNGGSKYKERGDCVLRAISIATKKNYEEVLNDFKQLMDKPPYQGVPNKIWKPYLKDLGWKWIPTMFIGSGCKVHMAKEELPKGTLIISLSRHLTCVIDHIVNDTYDPSREGTRCVYGYHIFNNNEEK